MKILLLLSLVIAINGHAQALNHELACKPTAMRCEYLVNPLGIDTAHPRFSWMIADRRAGAVQKAYRLLVGTDSSEVVNGKGSIWDSGKQMSDSILVVYNGQKLCALTRYFWKIEVWDKDGKRSSSDISTFETGMFGNRNWKGAWISDTHDINYRHAPYFRKEFQLKKKVKSARAYIATAGLYELSFNGIRVGDHRLDPMYTRFDRRTLYVVHDVTANLKSGDNAVGVVLGNGWYNHQPLAVWDFHKAPWRNRPAFCLDIRIEYVDGSLDIITSDRDWKTSGGPIVYNNIYTGEHYDARREQEGWDRSAYDDSSWQEVRYRSAPSSQIIAQQIVPIRLVRPFHPVSVRKLDEFTYVFDMGQNLSGVTAWKITGQEGTVLHIKHGERLLANGRLDLSNIDVYYRGDKNTEPFQTDILTLSGKKTDVFMPRFNYKGFRYVEVTSTAPVSLDKESVKAYFIYSDVNPYGQIETSSDLVNRLWKASNMSYLSNLMGYPTDCPQREKNGWTGDGHLAIEAALYNFDGITVYEKWLADHRDEQQPNGVLPDIIPTGGWGYGTANGLDWTSTVAIIPWQIYQFYGDSRLLRDCYDNIKRYVDYVDRISPTGLTTFGRGDWVPVKSTSNLELTSSVYFYTDAKILANAAKLFDKTKDAYYYQALADKIKDAVNAKFLDRTTGVYASGTQTEQSVPLYWDIVPTEIKPKVAAHLNRKVEEARFHLDVGVLGAKALLNALTENGYTESAYKIAVQDTYPSWGWWIVNGATTLLENWDLDAKRDISDNHMMFGEIGAWFFKSIGGIIPDSAQPGFKHIILKPIFPTGLDHADVRHRSPYGEIRSNWIRRGNDILFDITIPANSTATFYPPSHVKETSHIALIAGTTQIRLTLID